MATTFFHYELILLSLSLFSFLSSFVPRLHTHATFFCIAFVSFSLLLLLCFALLLDLVTCGSGFTLLQTQQTPTIAKQLCVELALHISTTASRTRSQPTQPIIILTIPITLTLTITLRRSPTTPPAPSRTQHVPRSTSLIPNLVITSVQPHVAGV